jgi:SAM-dependent methyltransferase
MYDEIYDRLIAESYDGTYEELRDPTGDSAFYARLAEKTGGPVLELGCGTGRALLPIAATGVECVGIDASPAMLEVLRQKNPPQNLEFQEGMLETFSLDRRFRLIFSAFRVFQHLTTVEQQLACLQRVRAHLAPDGLFAFDVFDPDLERIARPSEPEALDATFMDGEDQIQRFTTVIRDHTTQTQEVQLRFERRRQGKLIDSSDTSITMRWFYRYELEHLLARTGFELVALYGGYDERPYDATGEIIIVARAAGSEGASDS